MQKLVIDFDEFYQVEFTLVAIHTTLEDYKLAYLLNKNLKTLFKKVVSKKDINIQKKEHLFSTYSYTSEKYEDEWQLVANKHITFDTNLSGDLALKTQTIHYLVPERKNVDYFLKIPYDVSEKYILKTLKRIKKINEVITNYIIDTNTLKSKDFLIF